MLSKNFKSLIENSFILNTKDKVHFLKRAAFYTPETRQKMAEHLRIQENKYAHLDKKSQLKASEKYHQIIASTLNEISQKEASQHQQEMAEAESLLNQL